MWSERTLRGSYTYIHIHTYLCCAANKELWHLEAIHRAVIFDVDFVINGGQDGHCVTCISAICTHTFTYPVHAYLCADQL